MIDLHYWTTPNGHKVTLFLEEAGLPYTIKPVNIGKGDQFDPEFLKISPNNRIPAIVDHAPADGGKPISVFESGAILLYLAGKTGPVHPEGPARPGGNARMAHVADGRPRPHGRAEPPLRDLRAREAALRDRPLREGNIAALRRAQQAPRRAATSSWASNTPSPTWRPIRGFIPERQGQDIDDFPHLKRWLAAITRTPGDGTRLREGPRK